MFIPHREEEAWGSTHLFGNVAAQAHGNGCVVLLQVIKINPARTLYEQLGFRVCGATETHHLMINEPKRVADSDNR